VRDFLATDHLQRVVPPSAGGERETDLFAGIALDRDSEEAAGRL